MNEELWLQRVQRWLEVMVVGENLCPFAEKPLNAGKVRIAVCLEDDPEAVYRAFLLELERLLNLGEDALETTLLACPNALGDFYDYLDLLALLEGAISELELDGVLQIASFHPEYEFEGAGKDDPANYTNRSPCPLFHLLRESSISEAVSQLAQPERIPQRNAQHMRALGVEKIHRLLDEIADQD